MTTENKGTVLTAPCGEPPAPPARENNPDTPPYPAPDDAVDGDDTTLNDIANDVYELTDLVHLVREKVEDLAAPSALAGFMPWVMVGFMWAAAVAIAWIVAVAGQLPPEAARMSILAALLAVTISTVAVAINTKRR